MPAPARSTAPRDAVRYGLLGAAGIEVMQARFERHRFAVHAHDTWAVCAVLHGAKDVSARDARPAIVGAGQLYALPPGAAHAGRTVGDTACEYAMLYIPDAEWRARCAMQGVTPDLLAAPRSQPAAVARFAAFAARRLRQPAMAAGGDGEWSLFCESLLAALSPAAAGPSLPAAAPDPRLRRAADLLHALGHRNVTLDELAREASLSVAEFGRRFTAAYGLSPHRYQLALRLLAAKRLLLGGGTPPDVAAATGFADQSHLGRHFKAMFGFTPGAVARRRGAGTF
ncbi:AraC family transcriptional regulator [Burkholderia plantarii]|uniref:AraC family transcriptional regulator n=1 Tax=Burkholderia plantarii TaxID=41899 RepID=UPI0006D8D335|nr:AraC family transcriptional regulator [Burkholderia plantarii]ALK31838.1 AraC family transcriptional regulator [Burkholderia plantarii]GLZ21950.1 AraC family transcriptional regulator [Burkholderia plantarii]